MGTLTTVSAVLLWFVFGFGAAAHMLAFSSAADIVKPDEIGTSASIVNGSMFIVSGLLISRPGQIAEGFGAESVASLEVAQRAVLPLEFALILALIVAMFAKETHAQASARKA